MNKRPARPPRSLPDQEPVLSTQANRSHGILRQVAARAGARLPGSGTVPCVDSSHSRWPCEAVLTGSSVATVLPASRRSHPGAAWHAPAGSGAAGRAPSRRRGPPPRAIEPRDASRDIRRLFGARSCRFVELPPRMDPTHLDNLLLPEEFIVSAVGVGAT